jgi:hypothetical protein
MAVAFVGAPSKPLSAAGQNAAGTNHSTKRMADGKQWMTENLKVAIGPSYCYEDAEENCRRYGRL